MKFFFCIALALVFVSCAEPLEQRTATYNAAEYAPYARSGNGRIVGQAFAKTRGGEVRYGAADPIRLFPATALTTEWVEKSFVQGRLLAAGDPRTDQYSRKTIGDGTGNFEFSDLPTGDYFLICPIAWEVGDQQTGAVAHERVHVTSGQTTKIVLTP